MPQARREVKPYLIDGRTPDECLAQYQRIQREEAAPDSLTRRQRFVACALWSHDVRVAVNKGCTSHD
jgi:hypothetical protein